MRRHLVDTRHGSMHVREFGTGGTPLVLLHMGPLSGRMFDWISPLLAADRRVLAPDRIGFGASDPLTRPLEFREYAEATLDALDRLGAERFDVIGVHTGSSEALELATTVPERVRRVGLVGLVAFTEDEGRAFLGRDGAPPALAEDGAHLLWLWNRWLTWRPAAWSLESMQECFVDWLRSGPKGAWTRDKVFVFPTLERLPLVTQPLLVIAPHDYLWTSGSTQRGLAVAPKGTAIVEIPLDPPGTAPTGLFEFAAEELAEHILAFLGRAV